MADSVATSVDVFNYLPAAGSLVGCNACLVLWGAVGLFALGQTRVVPLQMYVHPASKADGVGLGGES